MSAKLSKSQKLEEKHDEEEALRRQIRKDQIQIHDEMVARRVDLSDAKKRDFEELRLKNNSIFLERDMSIRHTREQILDARNFSELVHANKLQASNLTNLSRRYDFDSFVVGLKHLFTNQETELFDWCALGTNVGALMFPVPACVTMVGPMRQEVKTRKAYLHKGKEVYEEEKPEEVIQGKGMGGGGGSGGGTNGEDGEEVDEATNSRVRCTFEEISKRVNEVEPMADLLKILVDHNDPVQTVENFFDYSFLVKEKRVLERIEKDGLPKTTNLQHVLQELKISTSNGGRRKGSDGKEVVEEQGCKPRQQLVLSMSMKEIKELMRLVHGNSDNDNDNSDNSNGNSNGNGRGHASQSSTCPLHRNDDLYKCQNAREQADLLEKRAEENKKRQREKLLKSAGSSRAGGGSGGGGDSRSKKTARKSVD